MKLELRLPPKVVKSMRKLTGMDVEVSGHLMFNLDGSLRTVLYDYDDQTIGRDAPDPDLIFHTHPADYATLYPDHPSVTDVLTTHYLMCDRKETVGHAIFTPKFVYLLRSDCSVATGDAGVRTKETFERCKRATPDRSTETFRQCYLRGLSDRVVRVERYAYDDIEGRDLVLEVDAPARSLWRTHRRETLAVLMSAAVLAAAFLVGPTRSSRS